MANLTCNSVFGVIPAHWSVRHGYKTLLHILVMGWVGLAPYQGLFGGSSNEHFPDNSPATHCESQPGSV